jgi:hypothetical protein
VHISVLVLRDNDIQIEAVNSLSMNQQPLLEVLGRNVQGMQCLLAMDRDKRDAEIAGMRASMEKTQTGTRRNDLLQLCHTKYTCHHCPA